jgi:hypothetical protein
MWCLGSIRARGDLIAGTAIGHHVRIISVHPQHADFDLDDAEQRVLQAVHDFIQRDRYLLERDANERSITHHLAIQLERQFPNWDVDCEYNRNHDLTKQLRLPKKKQRIRADDLHATTVFPDIIVHRRGTDLNMVVIEVKKSTNHEDDEWDRFKLKGFQQQLRYRLAVFIRFSTDNHADFGHWFQRIEPL